MNRVEFVKQLMKSHGRRVTAATSELVTVRGVEICATGIEYPLASGPTTFTMEDLADAVAAQQDPAIQAPRVWLGHPNDDRFHAGRATPAGSAEPALGKVENMRLENNGQVIVGDIVGVPRWLADILASAYPNRSVEGFFEAETATGHHWRLVITDLALLGVTWPGVSTLEDLQMLYSTNGPEGVQVEEAEAMTIAAARRSVEAAVNVDDVRRSYYESLDASQMWWFIRAIYLDPNELIVDDDEGGLYRVPFTVKGESIEFDDAQEVKIQYVNAEAIRSDGVARAVAAAMAQGGRSAHAMYANRAESRPESTTQEDQGMTPDQIRLLRARLNLTEEQLPDNATEAQITAALSAEGEQTPAQPAPEPGATPDQPTVQATTPSGPQPATPTPPAEGDPAQPATPAEEPAQALAAQQALPPGYVAVPAQAWAEVQTNAASGARMAAESERTRRERVIEDAVQAGRIAPAQRGTFRTMFERDPEGTNTLLTASVEQGGLMPGTIPVEARGADPAADDLSTEAYPANWLPEVQGQGNAAVTLEG